MNILRAYKVELDPNNKQVSYFGRCVGTSRYVYNWGLAEWKRQYEVGEKPSEYGLRRHFNSIKDELCPWIRELPYAVTESAIANLGTAFQNFFRRLKNGEKPGYPKFKKRGLHNSFQVKNTKVGNHRARITGAGWVRLKERDYIPTDAARYGCYATISEQAGRWFISVLAETEGEERTPTNPPIGIDVGIKSLAVLSSGKSFPNNKYTYKYEKKLARLQRELSRRKKGSNNRAETKAKIAKLHKKIADSRQYAQHQISNYATIKKQPRAIVIENLNVNGMAKNRHLARSVMDAGMSEIHRQIMYKSVWNGIEVIRAGRWFPSSKACSNCGCVRDELTLAERIFRCPDCGFEIDRDLNAARNLAALVKAETQPDCLGS